MEIVIHKVELDKLSKYYNNHIDELNETADNVSKEYDKYYSDKVEQFNKVMTMYKSEKVMKAIVVSAFIILYLIIAFIGLYFIKNFKHERIDTYITISIIALAIISIPVLLVLANMIKTITIFYNTKHEEVVKVLETIDNKENELKNCIHKVMLNELSWVLDNKDKLKIISDEDGTVTVIGNDGTLKELEYCELVYDSNNENGIIQGNRYVFTAIIEEGEQ